MPSHRLFTLLMAVFVLAACTSAEVPEAQSLQEASSIPAASSRAELNTRSSEARQIPGAAEPNVPSSVPAQEKEGEFDPLAEIPTELPATVSLDVPFTPQAPSGNWEPPFDEACEEASLLMVQKFWDNQSLTTNEASDRLRELVQWQEEQGWSVDITAEQVATLAREYYGYRAAVYTQGEVTVETLKGLLAAGYPVIIPAAGQDLGNPYFSGAGPPYHMLVLTGYDRRYFSTNDPGTRRGEAYKYTFETIMRTIHDWTGSKDTIRQGGRAVIVVAP